MKFLNLYNLILEELTDKQKKLTDKYTAKRDQNLLFGPLFKEERTYFPLKFIYAANIEIPEEIEKTLDNTGFYITDYRAGIAMKKAKPGEEKDLRQIKIGKILQKLNQPNLLKQFNERLGTSKKDIQNIQFEICVTHNPYDIAGMSTDRNWTSCMELDNGAYKETPLKQVQYGGMVAYLIDSNDKNIEKPYARIAIKRFISKNDLFKFIFLAEDRIYGDIDLADEIGFQEELIKILEKSNELTSDIKSGEYLRKDRNSYSDTYNNNYYWFNENDLNKISKNKFLKLLSFQNIPCKILKYFLKKYPDILKDQIIKYNLEETKCYDIDKELIEIFLQHDLFLNTFKLAKTLTAEDVIYFFKKYSMSGMNFILYFLKNKNIKFTDKDIDYILDKFWNRFNEWAFIDLFVSYKFNNKMLSKYLPKILLDYPKIIFISEDFFLSQDFPIDILIKYCDNRFLKFIYDNNKHLSKENKEKLKQYLEQHKND